MLPTHLDEGKDLFRTGSPRHDISGRKLRRASTGQTSTDRPADLELLIKNRLNKVVDVEGRSPGDDVVHRRKKSLRLFNPTHLQRVGQLDPHPSHRLQERQLSRRTQTKSTIR